MYDLLLMLHFIGLALGVGSGLAQMTLAFATRSLGPEERANFMMRASVLRKNGSYGLLLLLASGLGFIALRGWAPIAIRGGGFFHAKLTLVVILVGLFGYAQVLGKKAREAGGGPAMGKLMVLGRVMPSLAVAIIILAVLAFH